MHLVTTLAAFLAAATIYGGGHTRTTIVGRAPHPSSARRATRRPEPSPRTGNAEASFDDESETERLVAKSHELTNLTAAGSAPFALHASLFFNDPSGDPRIPPARGSYVFTWQSADKWREDAELLHLKQTEIANGNTLWTKRNAPYPSFSYWWTHNAMEITHGVIYHFDSRTHIEISQVSGRNVVCARNGGVHVTQELCLDTRTALPLLQYDATLHIQYLFGDWAQWGNHWYPRTIKGFSGTEAVMQVEIANVSGAPPETKWIVPPPDATQREWCADMRPSRLSDAIENATLPDPNAPVGATPIIGAIVYGVIGKDGNWIDLSVLESSDFKTAFQMLEKLRSFRNQPATCRGTPVQSETIFRILPPPR
jgi:hypothetical protein